MLRNTFQTLIKIFHDQCSQSSSCSFRAAPWPLCPGPREPGQGRATRLHSCVPERKYCRQFTVETSTLACFATGSAQKLKGKIISLPPCSFVWGTKRAAVPEGCRRRRAALGAWNTTGVSPLPHLGSPGREEAPAETPHPRPWGSRATQRGTACCRVGKKGPVLQRARFCTNLLFGCFNKTQPERTEAFWQPFFVPTVKKVGRHWDSPISELSSTQGFNLAYAYFAIFFFLF